MEVDKLIEDLIWNTTGKPVSFRISFGFKDGQQLLSELQEIKNQMLLREITLVKEK